MTHHRPTTTDPGLLAQPWETWRQLRPIDLVAGRRNPEMYRGEAKFAKRHTTNKRSTRA